MDFEQMQEQNIPIYVAKTTQNNKKQSNTSIRTRTYSDTDSSYVPGKSLSLSFIAYAINKWLASCNKK